MTRAWVKIPTSVLDLEVMDMKVTIHVRVQVPTEKMRVEKKKSRSLLLGPRTMVGHKKDIGKGALGKRPGKNRSQET